MSKRLLLQLLLLFLVGCQPASEAVQKQVLALKLVSNGCVDQQGSCRLISAEGEIRLTFVDKVAALRPFVVDLDVSTWSSEIESIELDFKMAAMDMGKNRYRLLKQADGHWQSSVVLPICGAGGSEWLVEIQLKSSNGHWQGAVPFRLQSKL